jgi:hypothetical protein
MRNIVETKFSARDGDKMQGHLHLVRNYYEGESNENRENVFKFNLLNESGTQLYHFST